MGLVAGALLAVYAPAIFFDGLIQKSVLDVFFVSAALAILGALATGAHDRKGLWLGLGLALGCLGLTRENALVLVAVVALWAWKGAAHRALGRAAAMGLFAAGVAVMLAPVALRNAAVGGGLYLTTSQFGPNFYIGNHAGADGSYTALRFGRGSPEYERLDATELAERVARRPLTPAEVSSYWTGQAWDFISGQPAAWLRLMARKAALLVNAAETLDTESQESHAEWSWPLRVLGPVTHFGVLVPLALVGVWTTWSRAPAPLGALRHGRHVCRRHARLLRLRALSLSAACRCWRSLPPRGWWRRAGHFRHAPGPKWLPWAPASWPWRSSATCRWCRRRAAGPSPKRTWAPRSTRMAASTRRWAATAARSRSRPTTCPRSTTWA